jgi:hypothetical protein
MLKRFGVLMIGLVTLLGPGVALVTPASASTGTVRTAPAGPTLMSRTFCNSSGSYCMTVNYRSVSGGIYVTTITSRGRTTGPGCAKEYVVVNGSYTRGTNRICYGRGDILTTRHVVEAKFSCGTTVLVDWRGTNAPVGRPGFRVSC